MTDTGHHLYGPSSLERRALCPASARLEKDLPNTESPYAAEGTMLHKVVAFWINIRATGTMPPGVDKLTLEQREVCRRCYEFAQSVIPDRATVYIEQKISLKNWTTELLNGTPDIVADDGETLVVIDWKFGRNPVAPADENLQGAGYAAMGMQTYKRRRAVVYFFQPRLLRENEQPKGYTFTDCPGHRRQYPRHYRRLRGPGGAGLSRRTSMQILPRKGANGLPGHFPYDSGACGAVPGPERERTGRNDAGRAGEALETVEYGQGAGRTDRIPDQRNHPQARPLRESGNEGQAGEPEMRGPGSVVRGAGQCGTGFPAGIRGTVPRVGLQSGIAGGGKAQSVGADENPEGRQGAFQGVDRSPDYARGGQREYCGGLAMKCRRCGWAGPADRLKGCAAPFLAGCPECWRHGRYIPAEAVK